ncbi:3-deoxy-D-arabino-heptulosonate 7-phosphate synthase [Cupriavidus sp. AU9028]|uniref:3-deoxy-D-arabino-heptulosonate 7-phosphate synthase n=1 Tax=Cupriavidus sp. AU9028 TaxID=2871157 RepID=UPI001C956AD2|nr:3-deoxy-D-arabino-heptulosonate 7-phosphate synthase [Cupriavidus sp. AU9028]MBY4896157.1 3-deoxy-D-arabino-heptulosonate 7-phosphate synthase [Cupriavidus sp. AU9028]
MPLPPPSPLLADVLPTVPRRYRLPPLDTLWGDAGHCHAATALALAIEQARDAVARAEAPGKDLEERFTDALARMVGDGIRAEGGDPVLQAMLLRHRYPAVREYASLSARAEHDRRTIVGAVNTLAHPVRQQHMPPGTGREALARLQSCASSRCWPRLRQAAQDALRMPPFDQDPALQERLTRLLNHEALGRLLRIDGLAGDPQVLRYQSLRNAQGPGAGSPSATALGVSSRQRGAAAEATAAKAVMALARRLNTVEGSERQYRVVTSMRVPSTIPASHAHAKTEWDVVLLVRSGADGPAAAWQVCLLVEVKASVDAATTGLPRLLRGLQLLAHAEAHTVYAFETQQGTVQLSGESLRALSPDAADPRRTVLYCCDSSADATARLLGAATRMQLLSAPMTLAFASALAERQDADIEPLRTLWQELLTSPRWRAVLGQLPLLRQVRDLMVHTADLLACVESLDMQ